MSEPKRDAFDTYFGCMFFLSALVVLAFVAAVVVGIILAIRHWW